MSVHPKVWWLYKEGRPHVMEIFPKMIQATKTKETPFEEFIQGNISLVNDEWTIPEHLIKWVTWEMFIYMLYFVL